MAADLSGLLVVSVEHAVAAPYLSGRLAEAGARVIKVERSEGDFARSYDHLVHGESAYFVWLNRGKESISLNLKTPEDMDLLRRMVAHADVFIQNLAPGALARLGMPMQGLRNSYPRLITVSISGYGEAGPYRDKKAYDLLVQAESGLSSITGNEHGSARVGVSVCDIACGVTAHQAVLQALFARERSGRGRHITVSLFHALADWMNVPFLQYHYGGQSPDRSGLVHPTIAPYGVYACSDGREILISIQNDREWRQFCAEVLQDADCANDSRFATNSCRVAHRGALDDVIRAVFGRADRATIAARLDAASIANGCVSTMEDLVNHPQNRFVTFDTPTGPVRMLAPGADADGQLPVFGRVPSLNEHGTNLRAEFVASKSISAQEA